MSQELKPCAHCGCAGKEWSSEQGEGGDYRRYYGIECSNPECGAKTRGYWGPWGYKRADDLPSNTEAKCNAIAAWNKRAQPAGEAVIAEWQTRYMGDPRQPGFWKPVSNVSWAMNQYKDIGSASNKDGWQVRPLYAAPPAAANQAGIALTDLHRFALVSARLLCKRMALFDTEEKLRDIEVAIATTESHALGGGDE